MAIKHLYERIIAVEEDLSVKTRFGAGCIVTLADGTIIRVDSFGAPNLSAEKDGLVLIDFENARENHALVTCFNFERGYVSIPLEIFLEGIKVGQ